MKFSGLAPFGLLSFSGRKSYAEDIYRALVALYGTAFDLTPGTDLEADVFATSRALGRVKATIARAGNQRKPELARDLIECLEWDAGIVPPPGATLYARRKALVALEKLPRGARRENVVAVLKDALGSDFYAYVVGKSIGAVDHKPANTEMSNRAVYMPRSQVPAWFRVVDPVPTGSTAPWVEYEAIAPTSAALKVGDELIADGETTARYERIVVAEVAAGRFKPGTFFYPHDAGFSLFRGNWPMQSTTNRHSWVVVTPAAATDPSKRATVDAIMSAVARGVSTWSIVASATRTMHAGTVGPLTITTPLGTSPVEAFSYVDD